VSGAEKSGSSGLVARRARPRRYIGRIRAGIGSAIVIGFVIPDKDGRVCDGGETAKDAVGPGRPASAQAANATCRAALADILGADLMEK
jgi:hypothetical protein